MLTLCPVPMLLPQPGVPLPVMQIRTDLDPPADTAGRSLRPLRPPGPAAAPHGGPGPSRVSSGTAPFPCLDPKSHGHMRKPGLCLPSCPHREHVGNILSDFRDRGHMHVEVLGTVRVPEGPYPPRSCSSAGKSSRRRRPGGTGRHDSEETLASLEHWRNEDIWGQTA